MAVMFATTMVAIAPKPAEAGKRTRAGVLGAVIGAGAVLGLHALTKKRRRTKVIHEYERAPVYYERAPRRYYRRAPRYAPVATRENRKIQESLNLLGFNVGVVDGVSGPDTRRGIADFQASMGQPATGRLTELQKSVLFKNAEDQLVSGGAGAAPAQ
jgi:hypothetical protein